MMFYESPLLGEIRRLHDERQTGLLTLAGSNGEHIDVFFREGMIDAVSSNLPEYRLGGYLAKGANVPAGELDTVELDARRRKISFGEAIVRSEVADQVEVMSAVRHQSVDLLERVVNNGFSIDSFHNNLRSYFVPARLTFSQLLLELARGASDVFEPAPRSRIVLSAGIDLSVFHWYPQELSVLGELKYPNTVGDLVAATGLDQATVKRILGVLHRLKVIETLDATELTATNGHADRSTHDTDTLVPRVSFPLQDLIPVVTNAVLDEKLEVAMRGSSFTSEQFKSLKVQLTEANPDTPLKVFTVSSPDACDGKSLVSATLAFSFAMDPGRRVVIVDCDLRNPGLEKYLGVPSEPGLLQYITNGRLGPYCYLRRIENLYFLTAGGIAPNPIEILSMRKMRQLIESLQMDFDTIILDAPPYSPIADARVVTGLSDGLIMVVRRGKTSYASADSAFKAVDRNKLLGVVFNDVKPMLFHTYYNFGYYRYGRKQVLYSSDAQTRSGSKNYLGA
jgi:capsular exopolysaccharide synthesis family protein